VTGWPLSATLSRGQPPKTHHLYNGETVLEDCVDIQSCRSCRPLMPEVRISYFANLFRQLWMVGALR